MYVTPHHSNVTMVTLVDSSALEFFFIPTFQGKVMTQN